MVDRTELLPGFGELPSSNASGLLEDRHASTEEFGHRASCRAVVVVDLELSEGALEEGEGIVATEATHETASQVVRGPER